MIAHIWFLRERERILGIIRDAWTVSVFLRECILHKGPSSKNKGTVVHSEDVEHAFLWENFLQEDRVWPAKSVTWHRESACFILFSRQFHQENSVSQHAAFRKFSHWNKQNSPLPTPPLRQNKFRPSTSHVDNNTKLQISQWVGTNFLVAGNLFSGCFPSLSVF